MDNGIRENTTDGVTAAPRSGEIEPALLQIWSEVLNAPKIGVHDDFLGLGGDSLAALRCINRIVAAFGVELPLDLFLIDSAPIAQIASEIARFQQDSA